MIPKDEIRSAQHRLASAQADRDTWRTSGLQEKYLEAYSRVEALELQLDQLRQQSAHGAEEDSERERLMAELCISYDGRQYHYGSYRYDRLEDAAAYARLRRLQPGKSAAPAPPPAVPRIEPPTESERRLMDTLAISYAEGVYRFGAYRYDRLADAIASARRR